MHCQGTFVPLSVVEGSNPPDVRVAESADHHICLEDGAPPEGAISTEAGANPASAPTSACSSEVEHAPEEREVASSKLAGRANQVVAHSVERRRAMPEAVGAKPAYLTNGRLPEWEWDGLLNRCLVRQHTFDPCTFRHTRGGGLEGIAPFRPLPATQME